MASGDKAPLANTQAWQWMCVGRELGSVSAESGFGGGFPPGAVEHLPARLRAGGGAERERWARGREAASEPGAVPSPPGRPLCRALPSLDALALAGGR